MRWIRPLLCCSVVLGAGCYSYAPATIDAIPAGSRVRTRLSLAEAERIQELLPTEGRLLEGRLVDGDAASVLIEVPVTTGPIMAGPDVTRAERLNQHLSIPRHEIVEVELKRLDRGRTALLIGVGAAVAGFIVVEQLRGGEARGNPSPGGGGPAEARVPVWTPGLRIPLP